MYWDNKLQIIIVTLSIGIINYKYSHFKYGDNKSQITIVTLRMGIINHK